MGVSHLCSEAHVSFPHGICEAGRVSLPVLMRALSSRELPEVIELRWEMAAWLTTPCSPRASAAPSADC